MFGSSSANQIVGIDIGESSIKLVQLKHTGKGYIIENYASETLPEGLYKNGRILETEQISEILAHQLKNHKFTAKKAVACVQADDIISKKLLVRADLNTFELAQWIQFEVDKFIPFPVSELNVDYQFTTRNNKEFEREVHVIACRKQTISDINDCLAGAGLEPVAIDVIYHALERAGRIVVKRMPKTPNNITAIFDVGVASSRFYVFNQDEMIFQRTESVGAHDLIDDISSEFSMSKEAAQLALHRKQLPPSYKKAILKPYAKLLIKEAEQGITAFNAINADEQICQLLLAGGSTRIGGLAKIMAKRLQIGVETLHGASLLKMSRRVDRTLLNSMAPQLAVACGAAMWRAP